MIGIFDSGVGGLTVLKAMRAVYPSIDAVYFGDIKNAPYGQRTGEELSRCTVGGLRFLLDHGATSLVSACNSVSASLVLSLHDVLSLGQVPLIEMVGPTVSAFKGSDARIALVATVATIESKMYQNAFRMIGKDIAAVAIPELAGAIERGEGEAAYEQSVAEALVQVPADSYDVLVLGCTHYPLVIDIFRRLAPGKAIFDPAEAVAERVYQTLWPREMGYGKTQFFISRDSAQFRTLAATLFPKDSYTISVVE
jgi:glutamate racemase